MSKSKIAPRAKRGKADRYTNGRDLWLAVRRWAVKRVPLGESMSEAKARVAYLRRIAAKSDPDGALRRESEAAGALVQALRDYQLATAGRLGNRTVEHHIAELLEWLELAPHTTVPTRRGPDGCSGLSNLVIELGGPMRKQKTTAKRKKGAKHDFVLTRIGDPEKTENPEALDMLVAQAIIAGLVERESMANCARSKDKGATVADGVDVMRKRVRKEIQRQISPK